MGNDTMKTDMPYHNPELPKWAGAAGAYSKAYRMLGYMAAHGHVKRVRDRRGFHCTVSDEMTDLIDALNKGEEERIKALLAAFHLRKFDE
jgi:hypothetical protein